MGSNLRPMFAPRAVAVVGASPSPDKAGFAMMAALSGAGIDVHPVNPRGGEIAGRTAVQRIADLPEDVDLAVLVIPPAGMGTALRECAEVGIAAAVICAGGFGESGDEGALREQEIATIAAETGIRVLGPNTSGFMNPHTGVSPNFVVAAADLPAGEIGLVAQSGGMNVALSFLLADAGLGLSLAVGLGNAVDVGTADVLAHLADDDTTRVIALHLEGVNDGRALMAAIRHASARKPVVALKVGRNDVGAFAQSHTGALIGSYALTRAALRQAGAVVVDNARALVDAVTALSSVRLAPQSSPGVALITGQAGPGLLIADGLIGNGVSLPTLDAPTTAQLSTLLPPLTYQRNPVDTGRPGATFPAVVHAVTADPTINLVGVYALDEPGALNPQAAAAESSVPILFASGGSRSTLDALDRELRSSGSVLFDSPDGLVNGLTALVDDSTAQAAAHRCDATPARVIVPRGDIDESIAKQTFASLGVRVPRSVLADSHAEAHDALRDLGGPVVVKVRDASIVHKSDVGGVHTGVRSADDLEAALTVIAAISPARATSYLLEEHAGDGVELIVGGVRDDVFGAVIACSLGGTAVELGGTPALRVLPIDRDEARSMIAELPAEVRDGHRGLPAIDIDALADVILAVGAVLLAAPDINEVEINPARQTASGLLALDALITRAPKQ